MRRVVTLLAALCLAGLAPVLSSCANKEVEHPSPSAQPHASASGHASADGHAAAPETSGAASAGHHAHAAASASAGAHATHWTYGGDTGPSFWGDLETKNATCKTGTKQSPIDIPTKPDPGTKDKDAAKLSVDYLPIAMSIQNNGHAIVVPNQANNYLMLGKKRYELLQLHFHSPSEHTIAGKRFELEMHLVHKAGDGQLAVVGVLFGAGDTPEQLADLFKRLPKEVTSEAQPVKAKPLNVAPLVSLAEGYYHYDGSLTTPPCSEGVLWFVMKKNFAIGQKDVDRYRELFGGRTNRMVMPLGDRKVFEMKP
jgi:carbonic anhydrase